MAEDNQYEQSQSLTGKFLGILDKGVETILLVIISLLFPGEQLAKAVTKVVWEYKFVLIGLILLCFICACVFLTAIFTPVTNTVDNAAWSLTPAKLKDYLEEGFSQDGTPHGSPLGNKKDFIITALFHDTNYYYWYHKWHNGTDIIPSAYYYKENEAYRTINEPVLFATCSGEAHSSQDGAGANYIYIICADKVHAVLIVHNKYNFLPLGQSANVVAGQPIAVMGSTGNSTGAHAHYSIKDLKTGEYIDPLGTMAE